MPLDNLQITWNNPDALKDLQGKVKPALTASLKDAAGQAVKEVDAGFANEKTPGGSPWAALSPAYAKKKGGGKILELTGALKAAATSPAIKISATDTQGTAELTVTGEAKKAMWHQFGTAHIPARPFFQFEGDAADAIVKAGQDGFEKAL